MSLFRDHLTTLADFRGRENRQPFWLWVLVVYGAQIVSGMVMSLGLSGRMAAAVAPLAGQDQAYLNQHPEMASQLMMRAMAPMMRDLMIYGAVIGLVAYALLAAAVVRRLHDGDRSGWWAAPVLAVQVASSVASWSVLPRFFEVLGTLGPNTPPDRVNAAMGSVMPTFALLGLLGMVGFVLMIGLIVLLALRGTVGPNRYGEDLLPPPPVWQPAPAADLGPAAPPPPARVIRPWGDPPTDR